MNLNYSIGCNVTECIHHSKDDNYCALDRIDVVKHSEIATTVESTDCASFKK